MCVSSLVERSDLFRLNEGNPGFSETEVLLELVESTLIITNNASFVDPSLFHIKSK